MYSVDGWTRRGLLLLILGLGAHPLFLNAALPKRRLGLLFREPPHDWRFLRGELKPALARLGWEEKANLAMDWRFAHGDSSRLPTLAKEIVAMGVDAVMTQGLDATNAVRQATKAIPIVTGVNDPVGEGFAESLARPGGNVTGVSYALVETAIKQVELLRETLPGLSLLTIVLDAPEDEASRKSAERLTRAAATLGIAAKAVWVSPLDEVRQALTPRPAAGRAAAIFPLYPSPLESVQVARVALDARIATMFGRIYQVQAGGLMSYRLNWDDETQRRAAQIDLVFRGTPPARIPFELPTRSQFVINTRTSRALGLDMPRAVLTRADQLIE